VNIAEITNSRQLRDFMSAPTDGVIECVRNVRGDILILGGSGKMGPELTEMVVRADAIAGTGRRAWWPARKTAAPGRAWRGKRCAA